MSDVILSGHFYTQKNDIVEQSMKRCIELNTSKIAPTPIFTLEQAQAWVAEDSSDRRIVLKSGDAGGYLTGRSQQKVNESQWYYTPFCTPLPATAEECEKIIGRQLGVDDYVKYYAPSHTSIEVE